MHTTNVSFGPRLVAHPTGALRAAVLVAPPQAIEEARPLPGEPNAVYRRAVDQQRILIKTLEYFGCEVTLLDAHTNDPYASAVVDATIVFENGAVMMRPSAMSRRPEVPWLESEFVHHDIPIAGHIAAPGLIDGSDVLMAGNTAFIGVTKRNNALGRSGFSQIARAHGFTVVEVRLSDRVPSLRAVAGAVAGDAVVLAPQSEVDHAAFNGFKIYTAERGDEFGAGVLNLGDHHVLADIRFPKVIDMLRKAGTTVEVIDLYDFARIGLTPSMLVADIKRV
jgi:dimethylargininase